MGKNSGFLQKIILSVIFLLVLFVSVTESGSMTNNLYAKNYFETLLGSNNNYKANHYNIAGQLTGQAVKPGYVNKNIEGYDLMPLPTNTNIFKFSNSAVKEYFDLNREKSVLFPDNITLQLYNLLSETAKIVYDSINLESQTVAELIKDFESATAFLDESRIKIVTKTGSRIKSSEEVNILSRLALFEAKQGLFLFSEHSDLSIYLLQFNKKNLRSYTVNNGLFDDKSYHGLCLEVDRITNPFFYKALLRSTLNGFEENTLFGLNQGERQVLFDVYGISLAEYYKSMSLERFKKGSFDRKISGSNVVMTVLLSMHFNNGGKILNKDSEGYALRDASCIAFQEKFSQRRELRLLQEALITSYIRDNHPGFFNEFKRVVSGEGSNFFEELFRDVERGRDKKYADAMLEEFINIIYYNTDEINAYIELVVEKLNSEENVKLSEDFEQVKWL